MNINCASCSTQNIVQKYCGNCGSLLTEASTTVETSTDGVVLRKKSKKIKRWLIGFLIFIGIITFGPIALDLVLAALNLDNRYSSGIAGVIGLVVMVWYGMDLNESVEEY